jgi:hypothetical protein
VAQETKILARNHKTAFRFFSKYRPVLRGGAAISRKSSATWRYAGSSASEKTIGMVEDDLIELWQRFLKDPRASEAEIRRMSLAALLNQNFRLQLLAWFLKKEAENER